MLKMSSTIWQLTDFDTLRSCSSHSNAVDQTGRRRGGRFVQARHPRKARVQVTIASWARGTRLQQRRSYDCCGIECSID